MADRGEGAASVTTGRRLSVTPQLVVRVGALLLGIFIGRSLAYQVSRGGLSGAIGGGLWLYGTVFGLLIVFAVAAIWARLRRRPVGATLRPLGIATVVLVAGAIVGNVTAAFTGGVYRPAAVLEASGTITLRLPSLTSWAPVEAGAAKCSSLPDGLDVAEVTGLELGTLAGKHLRGTVFLPFGNEADARLELWIDGADLPEGSAQPTWSGPIGVTNRDGEDRPGQGSFWDGLGLNQDPKMEPVGEEYPRLLAGTVEWTCELFLPS